MKIFVVELLKLLIIFLVVSFITYAILFYLPGSSEQLNKGIKNNENSSSTSNMSVPDPTETTMRALFLTYKDWVHGVLRGDWGRSAYSEESVFSIIIPRLKVSLLIASLTIILSVLCSVVLVWIYELYGNFLIQIGIPLNTIIRVAEWCLLSFIPLSISLLIFTFASNLGVSFLESPLEFKIIFPILCLLLLNIPLYTRSFSKSMRQISSQPFVQFSRGLGYSERYIWWKEKLPNALIFTLSLSVLQLSYLVGGVIIVEKIFLVPGLGSKLIDSVANRDNTIVLVITVLVSLCVSLIHSIYSLVKMKIYGR